MRKAKAKETELVAETQDMASLLQSEGLNVLKPCIPVFSVISTAINHFDNYILGIGGIPCGGHITQLWGKKSSGKSTLVYRIIAMAQRQFPEKFAVLFDSEFSYNRERARDAGVDVDRLQVLQGNITEEVYDKILRYTRSGACCIVVLDSLANTISRNESFDDVIKTGGKGGPVVKTGRTNMPGEFAKVTKAFVRDLCRYGNQHDVALLFTNQVTKLIGVLYGSDEDYPGGEAFKHNLKLSMRVSKIDWIEDAHKEPIGIIIKVKVDKNKFAIERTTDDNSHLYIYFKDGIELSQTLGLYDDAVRAGVLVGTGWISVMDPATGTEVCKIQGRDNVKARLANDEEFAESIRGYIRAASANVSPTTAFLA